MTPAEVVASHEGLIKFLANKYQVPDNMWEDWLQECRVALWKEALRKPGDPLNKLASKVIHGKLMNLHAGKSWTGEERTMRHTFNQGRERADATHYPVTHYQGWGDDTVGDRSPDDVLQSFMSNAYLDSSERPNLESFVASKLAELTPDQRAVVEGRSAMLTTGDVAKMTGLNPRKVRTAWETARNKLASELKEWINE